MRVGREAVLCMEAECHTVDDDGHALKPLHDYKSSSSSVPPTLSPADSPTSLPPCAVAVVDIRVRSPQKFSLSTAFSLPLHTLNMSEEEVSSQQQRQNVENVVSMKLI